MGEVKELEEQVNQIVSTQNDSDVKHAKQGKQFSKTTHVRIFSVLDLWTKNLSIIRELARSPGQLNLNPLFNINSRKLVCTTSLGKCGC